MKTRIAPTFDYLYQYLDDIRNNRPPTWANVNLGGGRHCFKTTSFILLMWTIIVLFPTKRFSFYFVRKKVENKLNAMEDIVRWMPKKYLANIKINKTEKTIKGSNFNLTVLGLVQNKQEGQVENLRTPHYRVDYCFVCFDQAWEFKTEDFQTVLIAIGGYKHLAVFKCGSPYDPNSPFFSDFAKNLPYNDNIMKTKGEQFAVLTKEDYGDSGDVYKYKEVWHWTNYLRVKKDGLLSRKQIAIIEEVDKCDNKWGKVIKYGKPTHI